MNSYIKRYRVLEVGSYTTPTFINSSGDMEDYFLDSYDTLKEAEDAIEQYFKTDMGEELHIITIYESCKNA